MQFILKLHSAAKPRKMNAFPSFCMDAGKPETAIGFHCPKGRSEPSASGPDAV